MKGEIGGRIDGEQKDRRNGIDGRKRIDACKDYNENWHRLYMA
jgi:hypothetical protein